MIHWIWLLLIVPAAFFLGFLAAALCGANRMAGLRDERDEALIAWRKEANALRLKSLQVDQLKRLVKKMAKKK